MDCRHHRRRSVCRLQYVLSEHNEYFNRFYNCTSCWMLNLLAAQPHSFFQTVYVNVLPWGRTLTFGRWRREEEKNKKCSQGNGQKLRLLAKDWPSLPGTIIWCRVEFHQIQEDRILRSLFIIGVAVGSSASISQPAAKKTRLQWSHFP